MSSAPMADPIAEIARRLAFARKLYHNSEKWYGEGREFTPNGQSVQEWLTEAFREAELAFAAAKKDGRREGLMEAAEIVRDYGATNNLALGCRHIPSRIVAVIEARVTPSSGMAEREPSNGE